MATLKPVYPKVQFVGASRSAGCRNVLWKAEKSRRTEVRQAEGRLQAASTTDSFEWNMSETSANITALLRAAASGGRDNLDALMAAIYDDLHRLAAAHLRGERPDHTLQPTALVHEAYLKLIDQRSTDWRDRAHFFAIAARVIRRILVDHARQKESAKRGAKRERLPLDQVEPASPETNVDLVALDEALEALNELDPRQSKIVELRFFGGMTLDEIAEALSIGRRSVDREWSAAKAWLLFRMSESSESGMVADA